MQDSATALAPELTAKEQHLFALLRDMGEVMVAYSGGTDSAYLAWAANEVLGGRAVAITADSASMPESHKRDAEDFVRQFGIRHEYIATHEFENPDYQRNDGQRCFHCKDELFHRLEDWSAQAAVKTIIYGVNKDDTSDFRPGHKAAHNHGVRAPLLEAGMTKAEIRALSHHHGLPTWDRPAAACLSSRIAYGLQVTPERVKTVESGEEELRRLGFRVYRVRHHDKLVRLEFAQEELPKALNIEMATQLTAIFRRLGFHFVTIDLEGYRQGSFNATLPRATTQSQLPVLP